MTPQAILEAIAALPSEGRAHLLARLRQLYGVDLDAPPRRLLDSVPGLETGAPEARDFTETVWNGPVGYLVVFDGGSHGDPGVGYGAYIIFDADGSGQLVRRDFRRPMTGPEAEYYTLLAALGDLLNRLGAAAARTSIKVLSDSTPLVSQVSGQAETPEPGLRELRDQARSELRRFKHYRLVHQPREDILQILGR